MCMYAVCFKRERSARRPPVFPASHCWNQVLTIVQSSDGLLARGSPGNWVKPLSHQPAVLCPGFQLSCWKKMKVSFLERYGLPLHILSLIFSIFIMASHLLLLFRNPTKDLS